MTEKHYDDSRVGIWLDEEITSPFRATRRDFLVGGYALKIVCHITVLKYNVNTVFLTILVAMIVVGGSTVLFVKEIAQRPTNTYRPHGLPFCVKKK